MKEVRLFLYGTLMFDEVWAGLGLPPAEAQPARLPHHRRLRLKNAPYPGVVPAAGAQVAGVVRRVRPAELERLDRFEGEWYRRVRQQVELESGQWREAFFYLFRNRYRCLLAEAPWDPRRFGRCGLAGFLRHYAGFRRLRRSGP